jgi:hypothetical protein
MYLSVLMVMLVLARMLIFRTLVKRSGDSKLRTDAGKRIKGA